MHVHQHAGVSAARASDSSIGFCSNASLKRLDGVSKMQEFDFYINLKKPTLGLYVRNGAGLSDLADQQDWQFEGHVWESELTPAILAELNQNGHAFQELGG
jgi:hypothetical protein